MSAKFNAVKRYYTQHLWTIEQVRAAVVKGWITEEEFALITGEDYE